MAQPSTCVPGYEVGALARLGVIEDGRLLKLIFHLTNLLARTEKN